VRRDSFSPCRVVDLLLSHQLRELQQPDLLFVAQHSQLFGIALLERGERSGPCGAQVRACLDRLRDHDAETMVRQRRAEAGDHGLDVETGGDSPHEERGIDRRLEQRQPPLDAVDVHAVADLEQPILDGVPEREETFVLWNTEIQGGDRPQTA
jgi:hypothetical protein